MKFNICCLTPGSLRVRKMYNKSETVPGPVPDFITIKAGMINNMRIFTLSTK